MPSGWSDTTIGIIGGAIGGGLCCVTALVVFILLLRRRRRAGAATTATTGVPLSSVADSAMASARESPPRSPIARDANGPVEIGAGYAVVPGDARSSEYDIVPSTAPSSDTNYGPMVIGEDKHYVPLH